MAVTYWSNRFNEQRVAMDDVSRTLYIYQQKDNGLGSFYYFTYQLTDPNNELGLFPGGNNYSNFVNQHTQEFVSSNFATYQNLARSKMVNLKDAQASNAATPFFRSAVQNYTRSLANGTTKLAKGYESDFNKVSQLTEIAPGGGSFYTLKFQSVASGPTPQGVDLRAVVDKLISTGQYSSTTGTEQYAAQVAVVDHFQANPYPVDPGGGGGGGGDVDPVYYEFFVCFIPEDQGLMGRELATAACNCKSKQIIIYGNSPDLAKSTSIYLDASGSSFADAGWYSDNAFNGTGIGKFWKGGSFTSRYDWDGDPFSELVANEEGLFNCERGAGPIMGEF